MNGQSVVIIASCSGTGKTTLNRRLLAENPSVAMSVSYTSRARRPGETEGVDYHYITAEQFMKMVDNDEMLEWAKVYGDLKGTALGELDRIRCEGKRALLEVDIQGVRSAKAKLSDTIAIFILPPSLDALWQRLAKRGTETPEIRWRRLLTARSEIACCDLFDYFVVNDDLEIAYSELRDIVIGNKSGKIGSEKGRMLCKQLLEEFDTAPWLLQLRQQFSDSGG